MEVDLLRVIGLMHLLPVHVVDLPDSNDNLAFSTRIPANGYSSNVGYLLHSAKACTVHSQAPMTSDSFGSCTVLRMASLNVRSSPNIPKNSPDFENRVRLAVKYEFGWRKLQFCVRRL